MSRVQNILERGARPNEADEYRGAANRYFFQFPKYDPALRSLSIAAVCSDCRAAVGAMGQTMALFISVGRIFLSCALFFPT